jgi:catechol 2,3-dioxygenase-like lactoylglutathione lyase family enzyme
MLESAKPIAFVPTRDPEQARRFYGDVLGLRFVADDQFALVFDSGGVMVRVVNVSGFSDYRPAPFTILGWQVDDAEAAVRELQRKGVVFERFGGMEQDALGIWTAPGGARVAWFKDPDGNVLSVSQH